jgi:aryl-alcohol dehydrogenase
MAARVAGATTIVAIDIHDARLELAMELGATHMINAHAANTAEELMRITNKQGVNSILDTTAVPQVLTGLAKALSIRGFARSGGGSTAGD